MPTFLLRLVTGGSARLRPGSRLRRRTLERLAARAFEGIRRDDYEFALLFYEPDVELWVPGELARTLGLAERYHGHQGFRDLWRDYKRDMDDLHIELEQLIDLGDRIAQRVTLIGRGRSSGVPTRHTEGVVLYMSPRGIVARQEVYWSWEEALTVLEQRE
jgi:ketosteroid isomerase-like protein